MSTELKKVNVYAAQKDEKTGKMKINVIEASQKVDVLSKSPFGKNILAAQMREQIQRELLYEGRCRNLMDVYYLAQGEEAVFDCDLDVPAASVSTNGLPIQSDIKSDRRRIETSTIASMFIVKWNEQNFRKFDVMELARRRGQASVQLQEDFRFYNLLNFAATLTNQNPVLSLAGTTAATNNPTATSNVSAGQITPIDMAKAIGTLRSKLLPLGAAFINPLRLTDFLMFNVALGALGQGGFGIFAPSIQEEALRTGLVGEIFGVPMIDSVVVPTNQVYVLAPKEYLGKMAIRSDVEVRFLSDANKSGDVFNIWEDVGMLIRYAKGIVQITVS
jgi:hypothetical protein